MTDELSHEARAIIEAARQAHQPRYEDRERVRAALFARIEAAPLSGGPRATVAKILGAILVVAALVLGVGLTRGREPRPATPSASAHSPGAGLAVSPAAPPVAQPEPSVATPVAVAPAAPVAARSRSRAVAAAVSDPLPPAPLAPAPVAAPLPTIVGPEASPPSADPVAPESTLEAEMRLVGEAQQALRARRPAVALALLDEHAGTFPNGVLAPERRAARVVALCDLGRAAEGRVEAARFLQDLARSPLADRVRHACPSGGNR